MRVITIMVDGGVYLADVSERLQHAGPRLRLLADAGRDAGQLAQWLLGLRWVAVLLVAAVLSAATLGDHVPAGSVLPLWVGLASLLGVTIALSCLPSPMLASPRVFSFQIAADVVLIGWLTHHAGGLANPFASIVAFHAVIAAVVLSPRRAALAIAGIGAAIVFLAIAEGSGLAPPACIRGAAALCRTPDGLELAAAGLGICALSVGCGMFVLALVSALRREREELVSARAELGDERDKLASVVSCIADVVVFADPSGRVLLTNEAATRLFPGGAPVDGSLRVCHSPEAWERLLARIADAKRAEDHPALEVGGRVYEASYARVERPDGDLRGVVMVARDITERLREQRGRMEQERMSVVGKLAAAVAHEVNNPLAAIRLLVQHTLKQLPPEDPLRERLDTVQRNADHCSRIVRDLLAYARQRPPERRPVDLGELVLDVCRTIGPGAAEAGVEVTSHFDREAPARILADPDHLRQLLVNLALNAVDAMAPRGGGRLTVRVEGGAQVRIAVEDTGPGVAPDDQERIFSAFFTTKPEGTGLGLAVARDIAGAHGGSLELVSSGGGSSFALVLPPSVVLTEEVAA